MGDVVNLNRFRKTLARSRAAEQAAENRARYGRTRTERQHDTDERERLKSELDRHRLDKEGE